MIMLVLMGYIHVDPFDVDDFEADIRKISRSTSAEKGCLFYGGSLDDRTAGRFLVAERWLDEEVLRAHVERDEVQAFLRKWEFRMKVDLNAYDVADERSLAT
jgi:quinol monooxygenase YgiN